MNNHFLHFYDQEYSSSYDSSEQMQWNLYPMALLTVAYGPLLSMRVFIFQFAMAHLLTETTSYSFRWNFMKIYYGLSLI